MSRLVVRTQYTNGEMEAMYHILKFDGDDATEVKLDATFEDQLKAQKDAQDAGMVLETEINNMDRGQVIIDTWTIRE